MSLAPKWAKASAVLGLKMQLAQLKATLEILYVNSPLATERINLAMVEFETRIHQIEEMKD